MPFTPTKMSLKLRDIELGDRVTGWAHGRVNSMSGLMAPFLLLHSYCANTFLEERATRTLERIGKPQ